jgi:phosphoribosylaminoimidazole carboxylase/phosphoribosylaminoimidazole-succinocarboxamide synthase
LNIRKIKVQRTGTVLATGKTKKGFAIEDKPDLVDFACNDKVTKNNDPSQTRIMPGKGRLSNLTNAAVMMLLEQDGIPIAWKGISSETSYVAEMVTMIPGEIIGRRDVSEKSSFNKRFPNPDIPNKKPAHRFHKVKIEWNLKTTGGGLSINDVQFIPQATYSTEDDDPWIVNPYDTVTWKLRAPKRNAYEAYSVVDGRILSNDLGEISPQRIFEELLGRQVTAADVKRFVEEIDTITWKTLLILEGAFNVFGFRFGDFKIEFGFDSKGNIVLADLIDSDSWRLRNRNNKDVSKQSFRDGDEMDELERKYRIVQQITEQFRIPQQAIVIWKGSEKDDFDTSTIRLDGGKIPGVDVIQIAISGHKSSDMALKRLEEILWQYPDGGVFITSVGMSNGLGPILAAHTSWQIIGVQNDTNDKPHNVWSSLSCPSNVPMLTTISDKNACLAALNMLAMKNPIVYALRQLAIEELDPNY